MRFSKNRLYIESYTKCPNCGVLIFEQSERGMAGTMRVDNKLCCSKWCVDWEADRNARHAAEPSAP